MRKAFLFFVMCSVIFLFHTVVYAQEKKRFRQYESKFQFSLFPGISSNGIISGHFVNTYSFNLFGGLSAGNKKIELSPISNVNLKSATGLHLAGLANVIGANAFINLSLAEERELVSKEGFESNSSGIHLAGFLNYVRDHSEGLQLAGVFNIVGRNFVGIQVASVGNSANGNAVAFQVSGFYNLARQSFSGIQLTSIYNYTDGRMSGAQAGLINKARFISGKHTLPVTRRRGLQIGLINFSKVMDGTQIGLINFGGEALGKQIGLINFFKTPITIGKRLGSPVAPINIGSNGSVIRVTNNELFSFNVEYTSGNCLNCSRTQTTLPIFECNQIYNQNALIVGFDLNNRTWGFGYGFEKILYNKSSLLPTDKNNKKRMISYGLRFLHLNRDRSFDGSFNLLNKLHVEYGRRFRGHYVFVGVSFNYFLFDPLIGSGVYKINSAKISSGNLAGFGSEYWPGYSIGFQI